MTDFRERQHLALLRIAGKTIRADFFGSPPPARSRDAQQLSRFDFGGADPGGAAIYWRNGRPGRYRLDVPGVGIFELDARRGAVSCFVQRRAPVTVVEEVLRGPVCSFFLVEQGFEPLHAGAVVLEGGCLAFAGAPGAGKSSLIAFLAQGGAEFFADDVLPMRFAAGRVRARAGLAQLRLTPHSLRAIGWQGTKLWGTARKSTLAAKAPAGTRPVRRIYLLERGGLRSAVRIEPVARSAAFVALVAHTRNISETAPARLRNQLRVCGWLANHVPVRRLIYPSGFRHLARVHGAILADLAG